MSKNIKAVPTSEYNAVIATTNQYVEGLRKMRVSFPAPGIKKWTSEKRSIFFVQRKVFL